MFTGIVEETGTVKFTGQRLAIAAQRTLEGTNLGDSIAVNGACLTVIDLTSEAFTVEVMPETLRRTNLGALKPGDYVNLERAMAVGDRLGGHFVQGHIDDTGQVLSVIPEKEAILLRVSASEEVLRYVVEKGFIAIDGVSLTVVERDSSSLTISLVGYTMENTILGKRRTGDSVNLEVDILAKYVAQLLNQSNSGLSLDFLAEHGFL
ncbi:MAG: riboflavin synthase [Dehalococcoidia bacterium]